MKKLKEETIKKNNLSKEDEKKLTAFIVIGFSILGFILAYATKKHDKYIMFYAKQSLIIFFTWIIIGAVSYTTNIIPIIGGIITGAMTIFGVLIWIICMLYSLSGKEKKVPIIGEIAEDIKI